MLHFDPLKAVINIVRKGEIACNKQFLLFSQCFLPYMVLIYHLKIHFKTSSAICFNLDQSKILSSGNGLSICLLSDRRTEFTKSLPPSNLTVVRQCSDDDS